MADPLFHGWHRPEREPRWVRLFDPDTYGRCWDKLLLVGRPGEYVVLPQNQDPNAKRRK